MCVIKEYDGFKVDDNFAIYSKRTGNKLTPHKGSDGYMQVQYRDENNKNHHQRVHVIFAHCFIDNPNGFKYINHIDGDKTNNDITNLEWCTNSYNVKHGWHIRKRLRNRTRIKCQNTITNKVIIYESIRTCSTKLGLDRHKIARIIKHELPDNYYKGYVFSCI